MVLPIVFLSNPPIWQFHIRKFLFWMALAPIFKGKRQPCHITPLFLCKCFLDQPKNIFLFICFPLKCVRLFEMLLLAKVTIKSLRYAKLYLFATLSSIYMYMVWFSYLHRSYKHSFTGKLLYAYYDDKHYIFIDNDINYCKHWEEIDKKWFHSPFIQVRQLLYTCFSFFFLSHYILYIHSAELQLSQN